MIYRECIRDGKAAYNSAGLLCCENKAACRSKLKLEQGEFCKQPLLDERKDGRWFLDSKPVRPAERH